MPFNFNIARMKYAVPRSCHILTFFDRVWLTRPMLRDMVKCARRLTPVLEEEAYRRRWGAYFKPGTIRHREDSEMKLTIRSGAGVKAAACAALIAATLGTPAAQAENGKTIAIIVPTLKITVLQIESKAAVDQAKALGYKTMVLTHDFNTANELRDADQIITEKVAGVLWNVADPDASAVSVKKVRDAGIPVINMDRVLTKHKIADMSLESDNYQCGAMAAEAFVKRVGDSGNYAEISGPKSDAMARTRSAGYHSVLDKTSLKMVAQQPAAYDQTQGFKLAGSILQGHPNIKGFVTGNDSIGMGAAAAIKAQNKKNMTVVGIDGGADAQKAIKSGDSAFVASAAQPVAEMGKQGIINLDRVIKGEKGELTAGKVQKLPCTLLE
jgi:erythritol transport system substrate-binding protein